MKHTHQKPHAPSQETGPETVASMVEETPLPELAAESAETMAPETPAPTVSREEHEKLKAERDQLFDRLARLQAEFDNARKREARERAEFRNYALASAVEQFLPVLDNFHLALRADGTVEQVRAGVELIVNQMEEVLRTLGVQPIATQNALFDPRQHEALEMVDRDDLPDHQILEEVRRGYTLRDRLLRPALVRVVRNPKQQTA